jgi:hypothetical protein
MLRRDPGRHVARADRRLGGPPTSRGSALAQAYGQLGDEAPDLDDADQLAAFFRTIQRLPARVARSPTTTCPTAARVAPARDGVRRALRLDITLDGIEGD